MQTATGTISIVPNVNSIDGVGTLFTKEASVGGSLYIPTLAHVFQVAEIVSDTQLLVANPLSTGVNTIRGLVFVFPDHFSPTLGLPLPTPHQLSVQTQALNRALMILDREIPKA